MESLEFFFPDNASGHIARSAAYHLRGDYKFIARDKGETRALDPIGLDSSAHVLNVQLSGPGCSRVAPTQQRIIRRSSETVSPCVGTVAYPMPAKPKCFGYVGPIDPRTAVNPKRGTYTANPYGPAARRGSGDHTMKTRTTVTIGVTIDLAKCLWPIAWALVWLLA